MRTPFMVCCSLNVCNASTESLQSVSDVINWSINAELTASESGFFFKQKTAYEIMPSLVGSEMCIRDRLSVT